MDLNDRCNDYPMIFGMVSTANFKESVSLLSSHLDSTLFGFVMSVLFCDQLMDAVFDS
jgi:hypothetical protein